MISLCDRVREVCPEFPGGPSRSTGASPTRVASPEATTRRYPAFERTADELATRIGFLIEAIEPSTHSTWR